MRKQVGKKAKAFSSTLLSFMLAAVLYPAAALPAGASAESGSGSAASTTEDAAYAQIAEAEANGDCASGQALVVYHASGAAKGSSGTLSIQSDDDPLANAGFEATDTWDLSAADSSQAAAGAEADGALATLSADGTEFASGSDVRVALVEKDGASTADLVASLQSLDFVEVAGPNYVYQTSSLTADSYSDLQWGLSGATDETSIAGSTAGVGEHAALAAEASGTADNVVAVLDTGVDYNNPDLKNQMWSDPGDIGLGDAGSHGYNAYANTYDPMPGTAGIAAHGTHCAGIIAAQAGNATGISGDAGSGGHTLIMALRVADDEGASFYDSSIAAAYQYLVKAKLAGVNVVAVNNSWGPSDSASTYDAVLDYLVNQAGKAGVLSCFAAGNDAVDAQRCFNTVMLESPYAVCVAASNAAGNLASFSSYQATGVDVAAPGTYILSTVPNAATAYFNALLSKLSGSYDATSNPNGKADKLSYYTDIASIKDNTSTHGETGFSVQLVNNSTGDALDDQSALSVVTSENGTPCTISGEPALKVTIDYSKLPSGISSGNVRAKVVWTMPNPFKGTTGLTASEYSASVTVRGVDFGANDVARAYEGLLAQDGTSLIVSNSYMVAQRDNTTIWRGSLSTVDAADDTLAASVSIGFDDRKATTVSGVKSCLVTAYGIGLATSASDADSAFSPYCYMSGTSMATPMVTGAVGELAALYPNCTALQLRGLVCGGTSLLATEEEQGKVASGGRFTFEAALDASKVNANTWSATVSGTNVTVHGYNLDDASLSVDGTQVAPIAQTAEAITFAAASALFDGASHRFDVTDKTTGRVYKASYTMPNGTSDSLVYAHGLPASSGTGTAALVATADALYCADSRGTYLYSCASPSDSTSAWSTLPASGTPWTGGINDNRQGISYTYVDGTIYAFASDNAISATATNQVVVFFNAFDIAKGTWLGWKEIGRMNAEYTNTISACSCGGTLYCAVGYSPKSAAEYTSVLFSRAKGGTSFAKSQIAPDDSSLYSGKLVSYDSSLWQTGYKYSSSKHYQVTLGEMPGASGRVETKGAISGIAAFDDSESADSVASETRAVTGSGIVIANRSIEGMGDMQLIDPSSCSVTSLGSYGFNSASGFAAESMAMYHGKLYINCVDHAEGSTDGAGATALYTLPADTAAKLETTDVIASASSTEGGTATVADWHGKSAPSITTVSGDTVTWTAAADSTHTFAGWYLENVFVSGNAVLSAPVDSDVELTARFVTNRAIRLWGDSALDTMSDIVLTGFSANTGGTVVLCTADNYPDALVAAGIAGLANAPVLLTSSTELSPQTGKVLSRLRPETIIVLGGTSAITDGVASAARKTAGAQRLFRCAGESRSGTAAEAYLESQAYTGNSFGTTAFLATGSGFADALSIAPYAYAKHCAIFLTESDGTISDETLQAMESGGIKDFYVVGGADVVPDAAVAQLTDAGFAFSKRLSGSTRYDTSLAIAKFEIANGMTADGMAVATGENYKDALCGAAFCGSKDSVLLLASDSDYATMQSFVTGNRSSIASAYIFGGTAAVSQGVEDYLDKALE